MNWYLIKFIFNIQIDKTDSQFQFDEQLRLINALSVSDAFLKARNLGKKEEDVFLNDKGEQVVWKFIDVTEVKLLQNFEHGQEIYSSITEHPQPEDINFIQQKAQFLQIQHTNFV